MSYSCPPVIYEYKVITSNAQPQPGNVAKFLTSYIASWAKKGWEPISIGGGGLTTSKSGTTIKIEHAGYVLLRRPLKLKP